MKGRCVGIESMAWSPVRPGLTHHVEGKDLLPEGMAARKVVLTRVAPQGEFLPHADPYHHVLFVLQGSGEGHMGDNTFAMEPGVVVEIPAGVRHGYRNTGACELVLITMNVTE